MFWKACFGGLSVLEGLLRRFQCFGRLASEVLSVLEDMLQRLESCGFAKEGDQGACIVAIKIHYFFNRHGPCDRDFLPPSSIRSFLPL